MKKLIVLAFILSSIYGKSQLSTNLTVGKTSYSPVGQGELNYQIKELVIQGTLSSHLDREDPAFVGFRVGYNFQLNKKNTLYFQPLYGYHLVWVTFHNTPSNYYDFGYGAALVYKHIKLEVYNINKYEFIGIGIVGLTLK